MERGDGSTSKSQRSSEMRLSSCSRLHENLGTSHSQGERRDRNQVRQSTWNYPMFSRSNLQRDCSRKSSRERCLEDTQGSAGRARILYQDLFTDTIKLEEGSLDVDGYVKSSGEDSMTSIGNFLRSLSSSLHLLVSLHLSGPQEEFWNLEMTFPWR